MQITRDRGACTRASFTLETLSIGPWHHPLSTTPPLAGHVTKPLGILGCTAISESTRAHGGPAHRNSSEPVEPTFYPRLFLKVAFRAFEWKFWGRGGGERGLRE